MSVFSDEYHIQQIAIQCKLRYICTYDCILCSRGLIRDLPICIAEALMSARLRIFAQAWHFTALPSVIRFTNSLSLFLRIDTPVTFWHSTSPILGPSQSVVSDSLKYSRDTVVR